MDLHDLHDPRDGFPWAPLYHREDEALARWMRANARLREVAKAGDPVGSGHARAVMQEWTEDDYR